MLRNGLTIFLCFLCPPLAVFSTGFEVHSTFWSLLLSPFVFPAQIYAVIYVVNYKDHRRLYMLDKLFHDDEPLTENLSDIPASTVRLLQGKENARVEKLEADRKQRKKQD